jgi:hypothetical protein
MIGHFLERLLTKRLSHSGVPHGSKDGEGSVQPIRPEQAVNRQVITCVRGHYARLGGAALVVQGSSGDRREARRIACHVYLAATSLSTLYNTRSASHMVSSVILPLSRC